MVGVVIWKWGRMQLERSVVVQIVYLFMHVNDIVRLDLGEGLIGQWSKECE